jgi:hypothetical protein
VTNAGTISGSSYAVDFTASATNRLVVDPGAVFVGKVGAASGGTNTLELAGGSGAGSIGGISTSFLHFQTLVVDAGATWTLTGANTAPTVLNNGTLNIAGSLIASTAVNPASTGLFQLQTGGTLEVAAATGTTAQVNFLGNSQLIVVNVSSFGTNVGTSSYAGTQLQNFFNGDKIDLKNFSSTGVTFSYNSSTGLLQLSNSASQVASLDFQTSSLGSTGFQATTDGASGTFITTAAPPVLTIAAPSLTVTAGGSVPLGITATPVHSNDILSVQISGVPTYESITAPSGDSVTQQATGSTNTWTITESAAAAGTPLTGLTLTSSYTGTGHPVSAFTVTASNTTPGQTASSASQTLTVTDPPAVTSSSSPSFAASPVSGPQLAALFDQFVAAGFHSDQSAAGQMSSLSHVQNGHDDLGFLSRPHHSV